MYSNSDGSFKNDSFIESVMWQMNEIIIYVPHKLSLAAL